LAKRRIQEKSMIDPEYFTSVIVADAAIQLSVIVAMDPGLRRDDLFVIECRAVNYWSRGVG
jgi:hypothetical protein